MVYRQAETPTNLLAPRKGGAHMKEFIRQQNLAHYRRLLAETIDDAQRHLLRKLIADEVAKEPKPPTGGAP